MDSEIREINVEDVVPFKYHSGHMYEGERLQQLMDSIENVGLINSIIVRPIDNGKYEIICGHNRAKAIKALGHNRIKADIRYGLSDDTVLELFYDSNLNQQSFSDWNYSQKIEAIKYAEKLIKENSRQGKRTDLEKEKSVAKTDETYVQSRQKLIENSKKTTTRDKMARRLGISTATLSKYRRIIKLPDDLIQPIARLLDAKKLDFNAAYVISNMRDCDIKYLIEEIEQYPDKRKLDLEKLKNLPCRKSKNEGNVIYPISKKQVLEALLPLSFSSTITPVRKTEH